MRRHSIFHRSVGLAALLLWLGIMIVLITGGEKWAWTLYYIVPGSVITIVATALLCRFWSARQKRASLGTLIGIPFCSVILAWLGWICFCGEWYVLTPSYWHQAKGTFKGELFQLAGIGAYCTLPAIVVVVYYHIKAKKHEPDAA